MIVAAITIPPFPRDHPRVAPTPTDPRVARIARIAAVASVHTDFKIESGIEIEIEIRTTDAKILGRLEMARRMLLRPLPDTPNHHHLPVTRRAHPRVTSHFALTSPLASTTLLMIVTGLGTTVLLRMDRRHVVIGRVEGKERNVGLEAAAVAGLARCAF